MEISPHHSLVRSGIFESEAHLLEPRTDEAFISRLHREVQHFLTILRIFLTGVIRTGSEICKKILWISVDWHNRR